MLTQRGVRHLWREFTDTHEKVSSFRLRLEGFLLSALATVAGNWHAVSWHLHRVAGLHPNATLPDIPPTLWEKNNIRHFNPFLSDNAVKTILEGAISWLRLCVLDDKLRRMKGSLRPEVEARAKLWQELEVNNDKSCFGAHCGVEMVENVSNPSVGQLGKCVRFNLPQALYCKIPPSQSSRPF